MSKSRLKRLQKELAEYRDTYHTMKVQWDNEKKTIEKSARHQRRIRKKSSS